MKRFLLCWLLLLAVAGVGKAQEQPVKILAIGNSFSVDAVEQNLHELAAAEGISTIIGNMYIGGCTLQRHVQNARDNSPAYAYRKIGIDGVKTNRKKTTLVEALTDEKWDYVSVQQASGYSGQYETYEASLPELLAFLRAHLPATTKIVFHQTWAYAATSKHRHFVHYNNDQQRMYRAIVKASRRAVRQYKFHAVIPSGTAIQNARGTSLGSDLTRDGYHLDKVVGRYIAACVWFETLFGRTVVGNTYAPQAMNAHERSLAQVAAHAACQKPYRVSKIKQKKVAGKIKKAEQVVRMLKRAG